MTASPAPIRELPAPEGATLRAEMARAEAPFVLRGLVRDWPAVRTAGFSAAELVRYLRRFESGKPVDAVMTPPEAGGRLFYNDAMSGFNFLRNRLPLSEVAEQALRYAALEVAPAVAAQSAPVSECLPGFQAENPLALLDEMVPPRIWLGGAVTTPTHLDEWNNLGCVVAGRRRFTLFPPEQIANLYIGPLDFAPTGAPVSLVRLHAPDFARFPRFRAALAAAQSAELAPGDALYIPPLWWHHVESLERFNVWINYWWHASGAPQTGASGGFDALLMGLLNVRAMPAATRAAWRALFEHYVFGDPAAAHEHIPSERRGLLGPLSAADAERLRTQFAQRLAKSK
jgi:hypothetical protein